ncbi:MAG: kelch repeat-containing protein [Candidatus Acidiferrum sp.]
MIPSKKLTFALVVGVTYLMSACSGAKAPAGGGGGGGGSTTVTIGGTVTGLAGTGLVLQNNGGDDLTITGTGSVAFTFKTALATSNTYAVTVKTQPSNPVQACGVTGGTGTAASTNITTIAIACVTTPVSATIGGTVSNLATGTSVILQNNGGDSLTVTANGPFTFKTAVTGTDVYAVTVLTQPTSPTQICAVDPKTGSGIATANVTNVAVSCVLSYTIGGTVTGLVGSGLILQNTGGEQLPISAANGNQAFTFKNLVPTGFAYTITIFAQPTGPVQTCKFTTGTDTGTATANVTSVVVTCPAVTYSVGGTIVGLQGVLPNNGPLTDGTFILENVLGNTLTITENGPFVFATPEALNDQFEISVFHSASTQYQGCTLWDYKGVVTANITNIVVDCAHNDWTWIDGTNRAGVASPPTPQYGSLPSTAPTTIPNPFTNTPGARYSAAGWTDKFGNLFLFGGDGWELSGNSQADTLNAPMNDLWVCAMSSDYCQWQLVGGYDPTVEVVNTVNTTVGAQIIANAQNEGQSGFYPGTPLAPEARSGAATWTDSTGNLWLFGGKSRGAQFLNDLWVYNTSAFNGANYTITEGTWTLVAGSGTPDQLGIYTGAPFTLTPGSRVNPVSWTDSSGNLWLFGGFGYDGSGTIGYLNDLWEYTGGNWIWISGGNTNKANQKGIYGTPGTASASNAPGGRHESVGWADANGNLWLFGGEGQDSVGTTNGILNDLWVYNIANNQWTYVMGSTTANQTGVYGLQPLVGPPGTTGAAGTVGLTGGTAGTLPGSRWGASGWTDNSGNFWLFGGWGLDSTATNGNGALNDLWVYTPNATLGQPGTWTWIKGSNTGSDNGLYGTLARPYLTHYVWTPGGRSNATRWVDRLGQLWLFGGEGYDSTSTTGNGYLNDLWRYVPYPD